MPFTREQIEAIDVGTEIAWGMGGRFGAMTKVVEIFAKREDVQGKLFVCGYREFGEGARISFSIKEGSETDAKHYLVKSEPTYAEIRDRYNLDRNYGARDD